MTAGTSWLNGTFGKVAKAGQVAGTKTRAKWSMALSNLTAKLRGQLFTISYINIPCNMKKGLTVVTSRINKLKIYIEQSLGKTVNNNISLSDVVCFQ